MLYTKNKSEHALSNISEREQCSLSNILRLCPVKYLITCTAKYLRMCTFQYFENVHYEIHERAL